MNLETFGKPQRSGTSQAPSSRVVGNSLKVFVPGEHRARSLWPPAGEPWVAVSRIADRGEPIGNGSGPHPIFRQHRRVVVHDVAATVPADHLVARNKLGQIFVRGANDDLLNAGLTAEAERRGRERIVGLEL